MMSIDQEAKQATRNEAGDNYNDNAGEARSRSGWFRIVVVVGIAAIIALLSWNLIAGRSPVPGGQSDPTTQQTPATDPTEGPLLVAAGEGGTDVATADGVTPIGYDLTCTGAVQAATNYLVALTTIESENLLTFAQYSAIVDEVTAVNVSQEGGASSLKLDYQSILDNLADYTGYYSRIDPAAGLFRVTDCKDQQATIDIFYSFQSFYPETFEGEPVLDEDGNQPWEGGSYVDTARIFLQVTDDGDWGLLRLVVAAEIGDDDPLRNGVIGEYGEQFTPEMRAQTLALVGPEWTEYTNAPE